MTGLMEYRTLYQSGDAFIRQRARSEARAWPRFGRDVTLCSEDAGQAGCLLFACRTDASMSNPLGIVHGGITAALVDTCMGITCAAQCDGAPTPTITMTVNYARPVPLEADVQVRVRTVRIGASSGQLSAEMFLAGAPEEILVTATGVYAVKRSDGAPGAAPAPRTPPDGSS